MIYRQEIKYIFCKRLIWAQEGRPGPFSSTQTLDGTHCVSVAKLRNNGEETQIPDKAIPAQIGERGSNSCASPARGRLPRKPCPASRALLVADGTSEQRVAATARTLAAQKKVRHVQRFTPRKEIKDAKNRTWGTRLQI